MEFNSVDEITFSSGTLVVVHGQRDVINTRYRSATVSDVTCLNDRFA